MELPELKRANLTFFLYLGIFHLNFCSIYSIAWSLESEHLDKLGTHTCLVELLHWGSPFHYFIPKPVHEPRQPAYGCSRLATTPHRKYSFPGPTDLTSPWEEEPVAYRGNQLPMKKD